MAFNIDASFLMFNSCNAKRHFCKIIEFLFCMFLKDIAKKIKIPFFLKVVMGNKLDTIIFTSNTYF